jgi:hypothetical protein
MAAHSVTVEQAARNVPEFGALRIGAAFQRSTSKPMVTFMKTQDLPHSVGGPYGLAINLATGIFVQISNDEQVEPLADGDRITIIVARSE